MACSTSGAVVEIPENLGARRDALRVQAAVRNPVGHCERFPSLKMSKAAAAGSGLPPHEMHSPDNPEKSRGQNGSATCLCHCWALAKPLSSRQSRKQRMSQVIALVDDDRNILTSVSIALQQEGFVTRVYSDPMAALKAVGDNPPDLGVFDIKMPGMDGMELLRRVREFSSMPVIFLTSKDDELDEALGLAMGADDYISKPFSQRLLIARIRALLRRQELARGEAAATGADEPSRRCSSGAAWSWTRRATKCCGTAGTSA